VRGWPVGWAVLQDVRHRTPVAVVTRQLALAMQVALFASPVSMSLGARPRHDSLESGFFSVGVKAKIPAPPVVYIYMI